MGYLGSNATFTGTQNNKRVSVIATQGQTSFLPAGGYAINAIDVYRNGVKLAGSRDFTALDGVTVNLVSAANADDILEFIIFENFQRENVVTGDGDSVINGSLTVTGTLTGDITNASFASTAGVSTQVSGFLGVGVTGTNLNLTGIVTASEFSGNITGTAATFSGDLSVGGVLTYDDVTNVDSLGIITARSGVSIADSIFHTGDTNTAIRFPAADTFAVETGGTERIRVTSAGRVGIGSDAPVKQLQVGKHGVSAEGTIALASATNGTCSILMGDGGTGTDFYRGYVQYNHSADAMLFATSVTERLRITSTGGFHFTNGELIERVKITAGKLSDNTTINLDNGMVHYFTTTETTTAIPNITTTAGINTNMATGDTMSVTIITTAATAGYSTGARIDAGSTLPVLWNGGSDPSAGGSAGVDLYNFQVIKTGDATFTILGNVSNFA